MGGSIGFPKISKAVDARRPIALSWDETAPDPLRKTGISLLGDLPWGTHICLFYETLPDLSETVAAYFKEGLKNNEFCLWVVHESIAIDDGLAALRQCMPDFDSHLAAGRMEIRPGRHWTAKGTPIEVQGVLAAWRNKLQSVLERGYDGMRFSFNSVWQNTDRFEEFCGYERILDRTMAGEKMMGLCAYPVNNSGAQDTLNVARAHQCTIAIRSGHWDFLEVPESKKAQKEIRLFNSDLEILSKPFAGRDKLTPREMIVLAQIAQGLSTKEIARTLKISPRTVEFHRANIMGKVGAKNSMHLVRLVLEGT